MAKLPHANVKEPRFAESIFNVVTLEVCFVFVCNVLIDAPTASCGSANALSRAKRRRLYHLLDFCNEITFVDLDDASIQKVTRDGIAHKHHFAAPTVLLFCVRYTKAEIVDLLYADTQNIVLLHQT